MSGAFEIKLPPQPIYSSEIEEAAKKALGLCGPLPSNADLPFLNYRSLLACAAAKEGYDAGREAEAIALAEKVDRWFRDEMKKHPRCDYAAWCAYFRPILAEMLT